MDNEGKKAWSAEARPKRRPSPAESVLADPPGSQVRREKYEDKARLEEEESFPL